jgi:hypothetical protein
MAKSPSTVSVAIAGGGIAGLTAALRLAQTGCKVTVYERAASAGGNLGGELGPSRLYHDVYPHMFGDWYDNFWNLVEEIGLSREQHFEPRPVCAFLAEGDYPNFKLLDNNGSIATALKNLTSGIIPVPDMFLAAYSILDLLTQDFERKDLLNEQSVNGFLISRPYVTEKMVAMHDMIISNIWAVNSYLTSAYAYQSFAKYQFRRPAPQCWVLKGDSYSTLIKPLLKKLHELGCEVKTNTEVRHVRVKHGKVVQICVHEKNGTPVDIDVQDLILAVPPRRLAQLVMSAEWDNTKGAEHVDGEPIVRLLPRLSELRRIHSEPIPVYYVAFRRKLPGIPNYYVSLLGSLFEMTFVDVSSTTPGVTNTVLAVAVSDFYALPNDPIDPETDVAPSVVIDTEKPKKSVEDATASPAKHTHHHERSEHHLSVHAQQTAKMLILKELNKYVPFKLGEKWGDRDSDVDWNGSFYHANEDHPLFINEVGNRNWCPQASYDNLPNCFFAGDYCENPITIATVEAAVVSGLLAAQALCQREQINTEIKIIEPEAYPENLIAAWKIVLAPYAAAAKVWSDAKVTFDKATDGEGLRQAISRPGPVLAEAASKATVVALDFWKALGSLYTMKRG